MANWATTTYCIEGKREDLEELYNLCQAFIKKERPVMQDGASEEWEDNIVLALGEEIDNYYIRGFIQEYELMDGVLTINASEAWGATDFRHILRNHYPDMTIYYMVEEYGEDVFATNDAEGKYFPYHFSIDCCINGSTTMDEFETKEEALKWIAEALGRDTITMGGIKKWNLDRQAENSDDYICLYEYTITDN